MSTCARAPGGIDYRHLRKLACVIIRMSGSGSLVYNQGRMRLISPAELITFPESSRTSRHAHRSREFQSKSIKEKSLHRKNRMFGFIARCQRQICDPFKTGLHQSLTSMGGYKI